MTNLEKLIRYLLINYPNSLELSKPRLVKLIYLIDWKYTIETGDQYTNINWIYNHYGPYVEDVINVIKSDKAIFKIESSQNPFGGITDKFELIDKTEIILENKIKEVTDLMISYTYKLNWTEFINLIYSSYPIRKNLKYSSLDLKEIAKDFNKARLVP